MDNLKKWRAQFLALIDALLILMSFSFALAFRYSLDIPYIHLVDLKENILVIIETYIAIFYIFGMYKSLWTYAGTDEFVLAIAGGIVGHYASTVLAEFSGSSIPYSINLLAGIFIIILTCGFRISSSCCFSLSWNSC